ncbi:sensor domain-containing diguanylate cyclase [Rhizorhabdus wittichii]|uniref:sensor domain-containing diguanylate cyclase n=1 Tax=Rhizorhabdus wittichii TaxID=160791 RepID=UPI00030C6E4C|nr:sensor domain-containing diguanylate cyclase [Rhizorhabdus wittichii]
MAQLSSHRDWSKELLAVQSAIAATPGDIDQVMDLIVVGALRTIPHAAGALVEMRDRNEGEFRAASGMAAPFVGARERFSGTLFEQCVLSRRVHHCPDTQDDPLVDAESCRALSIGSILLAPVVHEGAVVGVLKLYGPRARIFDEQDMLIAQLLAGLITTGLARMDRRDAHSELDRMATRFKATFDQAAVGIAHVAPDGRFLLVNDRFCTIAGHSREALMQGGFQQITHSADLDSDLDNVHQLVAGDIVSYVMEKRYVRADRQIVWVNLTVSLVRNGVGHPDFFVAVVEDITRRKMAEERALHDPLTGLPNRRWLAEHFGSFFGGMPRESVIAYLDLDGFKAVNDRFGHAEGDRCLSDVASSLERVLRDRDSICRIAGDEFVILMPDTDHATALGLIGEFRSAVRKLCRERPWKIGISTGAVMIDAQQFASLDDVLEAADRLMYRAKKEPGIAPIICNIRDVLAA